MAQYLLSVYQPVGPAPDPEVLAPIMQDLEALNSDMKAAGVWVFAAGLHPTDTAAVVRQQGTEVLVTDGPFAQAKEHLGGFTVIEAPDFDAALGWARRLASATTLPIEVRPIQH
jgi:hypothetical protein